LGCEMGLGREMGLGIETYMLLFNPKEVTTKSESGVSDAAVTVIYVLFLQIGPTHFTNTHAKLQGAYNSGKPGKLREFCNSGKLREF